MSRSLTAGMITEVTAAAWRPIVIAYLDFPSGTVRVWDGIGNLSWNAQTWTGIGTLGQVSFAAENTEVRANSATLSLSGVDPSMLAIALADKIRGQDVSLWIGALDGGGSVVADPIEIFTGRMDHMTITEEETSATINVYCESHLIDLNRASEWRYSHEHQQSLFAGDLGFEFAATTVDQEIHWNQKNVQKSVPESSASNFGNGGRTNPWKPWDYP